MPGYAYLDSSAIVKLTVQEPETSALEHWVLDRDALISSEIAAIELTRAVARVGRNKLLTHVEAVLDAIFLASVTPAIRHAAGVLAPSSLRTLDAIHIATAASLGLPNLEFVTYDDRQADAARDAGLRVSQPGRKPARAISATS